MMIDVAVALLSCSWIMHGPVFATLAFEDLFRYHTYGCGLSELLGRWPDTAIYRIA